MATRSTRRPDGGFSFIELLAYMAIAALLILAALPQFGNYRTKASTTNLTSDLRNAAAEMEAAFTDDKGYPAALPGSYRTSRGNSVTVEGASPSAFCLAGATEAGVTRTWSSQSGLSRAECRPDGAIVADGTKFAPYDGVGFNDGRYSGDSRYSLLTGLSDGPAGYTTAARLTWTTDQAHGRGWQLAGNPETPSAVLALPVTAGSPVKVSMWVKASSSTLAMNYVAHFSDDAGRWIGGYQQSSEQRLPGGVWTKATFTMTPPAGATNATLIYSGTGNSQARVGDTLDATGLIVQR